MLVHCGVARFGFWDLTDLIIRFQVGPVLLVNLAIFLRNLFLINFFRV